MVEDEAKQMVGNKILPAAAVSDADLEKFNAWLAGKAKTFFVEFSEPQLQALNMCLVKAPYEIAAPLINHINQQIAKQGKQ